MSANARGDRETKLACDEYTLAIPDYPYFSPIGNARTFSEDVAAHTAAFDVGTPGRYK
ncbi:hypothetical protein [Nitrosospira sp. Is2]|uniref:hypothetical protein n=1 Tax=Nitrosospira sp. Is2 TaxID=3080532 RepID=UPI0029551A16|nr:hypothetical protein [Nitrosospira sp. Is2]WON72902.1 hypothetical protein R5L00_10390 [Nitrosospira sp. Is2]